MIPVARRAATAALAGAAFVLTLVFCSTAGAATPVATTTRPTPTPTSRPAPPVTTPKTRQIVLIGTAASVQSPGAIQSLGVRPVRATANDPAQRTLPHTGTASLPLALFGFALLLVGALAMRGQRPQLRWAERS